MWFVVFAFAVLAANDASAQPQPQTAPAAREDGIFLIFPAEDAREVAKHLSLVSRAGSYVAAAVDPTVLAKSFSEFRHNIGPVLTVPSAPGGYAVEAIQLQLQIAAEGSFGLIAGGKVGAMGGIVVILKRPAK